MDLDEIQSVQSRERQTDSLQQLRDSFYKEAGEFVRALRAEREEAAERADDPFDSPEVNRLSDDITTAEQTLEAIYERRVGKIVKMASLAAADMPTSEEGLTTEERDLFETLVTAIEENRQRVFDVLDGETSADGAITQDTPSNQPTEAAEAGEGDPSPDDRSTGNPSTDDPSAENHPTAEAATDGERVVSAADLMSEGAQAPSDESRSTDDETTTESATGTAGNDDRPVPPEVARGDGGAVRSDGPGRASDASSAAGDIDRTTVRVTDDVGEILGVDDRAYDLTRDDIVELPDTNAKPLLEQGAAERLD